MDEVDYCGIYVTGVADHDALVALVEAAVDGRPDGVQTIWTDGIDIHVGTNSSNPKFEAVPPDPSDFVWWPYLIDLEVDERRGVPLVTSILRQLWDNGVSAVAACNFGGQLPRSGGYHAGRLILTDE